jgi:hypothetical protein
MKSEYSVLSIFFCIQSKYSVATNFYLMQFLTYKKYLVLVIFQAFGMEIQYYHIYGVH